jgi:lysozyme family protein
MVWPVNASSFADLPTLQDYRLMIVAVNIGYIRIINQWLEHSPSHQIFLEVDDDICPLDIV